MSASRSPLVLIVEDSPMQANLAQALLRDLGLRLAWAETGGNAMALARAEPPDAILLDLELPDFSGYELMRRLKEEGLEAAIIVVTANASVNAAVEAMRAGAVDFVVKPYSKARLSVTLTNALEKRALVNQLRDVRAQLERDRFFGFVGAAPSMQAVYRSIESVAASKANVFVTGESGTGKELAADALHRASPRRGGPFVALNCGAIPRDLLESEIFGHVKGAFTGATETRPGAARQADGGTLFLDEIAEMPLEMQVKLLRFVQTGSFQPVGGTKQEHVDVRFVCATNRDPLAEVTAGRFREDLFYRLYVVPIELPPLRARGADVALIARHFLLQFAREERKRFTGFSPAAEAALLAYLWPGNVRQLQNVVRNVVALHDGETVEPEMLPAVLLHAARAAPAVEASAMRALPAPPVTETLQALAGASEPALPAPAALAALPAPARIRPMREVERAAITTALDACNQDVVRAAALLEIHPATIYRRLSAWRAESGAA